MGDSYYRVVRAIGRTAFWSCSRPIILHLDRIPRHGAFILAATHSSPFDVACLIRTSPRILDFVSIVEVFKYRPLAWFYGNMNAFPLDRHRPDIPTVRTILGRLTRGRVIAMFPEGRIPPPEQSVLAGGSLKPGLIRIAARSGAPIVPCVIVGAAIFGRFSAWLPFRHTRYALAIGEPIRISAGDLPGRDTSELEALLRAAYHRLHDEILAELERRGIRLKIELPATWLMPRPSGEARPGDATSAP